MMKVTMKNGAVHVVKEGVAPYQVDSAKPLLLMSTHTGLKVTSLSEVKTISTAGEGRVVTKVERPSGSLEWQLARALREARGIDAYAYGHTLEMLKGMATLIGDETLLPRLVKGSYEEGRG